MAAATGGQVIRTNECINKLIETEFGRKERKAITNTNFYI